MQQQFGQAEESRASAVAAGVLPVEAVAAEAAPEERAAEIARKRVEAVVETLADLRGRGESLAEIAHDARNMVTALGLYCDLL